MRHHHLPVCLLALLTACKEDDPHDSGGSGDSGDPGVGPTAVAQVDPTGGTVPLTVTLDGSASVAGDQPISTWAWSLPDGTVIAGETVETVLLAEGTHPITLTVVDEGGRSAEASVEVAAVCPEFDEAAEAGILDWGEVSGMAAASTAGFLWGHSDAQGDGPVLYAFSTSGALQGIFTLAGISDYDWEDIARGPCSAEGGSCLYIADTGDNAEIRSSVEILRVEEPTALDGGTLTGVERFAFTYPDGPRDAETLMVDPLTGDILIVERDRDDAGESDIYWAAAPLDGSATTELTLVGHLTFGTDPLPGDVDATGGDISPDGGLVAVRTHDRVWLFARDPARPVYTAFDNPVCDTPPVDEAKGEALAFALDGSGYFTGGEGVGEPLHWFGGAGQK